MPARPRCRPVAHLLALTSFCRSLLLSLPSRSLLWLSVSLFTPCHSLLLSHLTLTPRCRSLQVVKGLGHGDFVRIKVCHMETTQPRVLTLKMDLAYWPTWELRLNPHTCTWERKELQRIERVDV